jgi:hypothetical protein
MTRFARTRLDDQVHPIFESQARHCALALHGGAGLLACLACLACLAVPAAAAAPVFGAPVDLSAAGQDASAPQVAFDGAGNALAVWRRFNGSNTIVQGAFGAAPSPPGAGPTPGDSTAPVGEALRFDPRSFAAAKKGASINRRRAKPGSKVSYRLSEAASVSFTAQRATQGRKVGSKCRKQTRANRKRKKCTLYKTVKGSFTHSGSAGANSFRFTGRIANKPLRSGSYRLVGVPRDPAGNVGKPFRGSFKIVKR